MAYLTHNAYRDYSSVARKLGAPRIGYVAAMAIAVALVGGLFVALSQGGGTIANTSGVAMKGDRLATAGKAAPNAQASAGGGGSMVDGAGQVVFQRDEAQRTTTVMRGATIPLSETSPYPGGVK